MKTRLLTLMLCCLLLPCGCTSLQENPKAEYLAAEKTFAATVSSLTVLKREGKLDEGEIATLTTLLYTGDELLAQWKASVEQDEKPDDDVISKVNRLLVALLEMELKKGGGT